MTPQERERRKAAMKEAGKPNLKLVFQNMDLRRKIAAYNHNSRIHNQIAFEATIYELGAHSN